MCSSNKRGGRSSGKLWDAYPVAWKLNWWSSRWCEFKLIRVRLPTDILKVSYLPLDTPLLRQIRRVREATKQAWVIVDGLEVLPEQAIAQFELMTGRRAPKRQMRQEVRQNYHRYEAQSLNQVWTGLWWPLCAMNPELACFNNIRVWLANLNIRVINIRIGETVVMSQYSESTKNIIYSIHPGIFLDSVKHNIGSLSRGGVCNIWSVQLLNVGIDVT